MFQSSLYVPGRNLWQKVLNLHRDIAALASVVDDAKPLLSSATTLKTINSDIDSKLDEVKKHLYSLKPVSEVMDKLKEGKGSDAAKEVRSELATAMMDLQSWAREILCPTAVQILDRTREYLDQQISLKPDASNQETAAAYTGCVPSIPKEVAGRFELMCFLAAVHSIALLTSPSTSGVPPIGDSKK